MAAKVEYQIVGRYMNGTEVVGYHLQSIETGKSGRYSREQVYYLVGRDQVTNCTGQIYQDKVLLRGKGISLDSLPIINEEGELKRAESVGKVRRGTSASQALEQFMVVKLIKDGRNTVGYVIQNAGGATKRISKEEAFKLADSNKLGNARLQNYKGVLSLRGVNTNLDELPIENSDKQRVPNTVANKNVNMITNNRAITSKLISISQVYYTINKKIEVALVDFGVSNPNYSREQLVSELESFKQQVKNITGHNFYNTDDINDTDINGKTFITTFDDPMYKDINQYINLAKKLGAEFAVDKYVAIFDESGSEIVGELENSIKQTLAQYIR